MAEGFTVLCLGYSRIVARRVLPALERVEDVTRVELASRRGPPEAALLPAKVARCHHGFATALEEGRPDLVYVSTVNSEHAGWARAALERGCHVVVDKPSFTRFADGERLIAVAESRGLCLAEATVYAAHPQIVLCRQAFEEAASRPTRISAIFTMPPLAPDDFRYRADLGGGALFDLGPYAVSLGRLFFGAEPDAVHCVRTGHSAEVETAFSALLSYPGGRTLAGHFGFDAEYRNEATLLGDGVAVRLSRIFTTPPDLENELEVHRRNVASRLRAPAADSFASFLAEVVARIRKGSGTAALAADLRADLETMATLRRAAEAS